MIEIRQFITTPEWQHSDLDGKLNNHCRVTITRSFVETDTNTVVGVMMVHNAVLTQQPDGSWAFDPWPVIPKTTTPFEFDQKTLDRLAGDIGGDVSRRGVQASVLPPVKNPDGTATVTAVFFVEGADEKYERQTKETKTSISDPDLSGIADVVSKETIAIAKDYVRALAGGVA